MSNETTLDDVLALVSKADAWRCTGDKIRCHDGNGCECDMRGAGPVGVHEAAINYLRAHGPAIKAALEDARRLDYIERTYSGMTNRERYLPVTMGWGRPCNGRTLREACDKYMKRDAAIDAVQEAG